MISKVVASEMEGAQTNVSWGYRTLNEVKKRYRRTVWEGRPERVRAP